MKSKFYPSRTNFKWLWTNFTTTGRQLRTTRRYNLKILLLRVN